MLVLASLVKTRLCKHLKYPSGFNGICDASAMDALPTELFVLVTRRPLILSRETKRALFYHAKPRSGNHGGEAWSGKTKLFWSPGTIWPPCDKGQSGRTIGSRDQFLESPETLRAIFGCHNSLCISRTERI